jgi:hypothetical protein
MSGTVEVVSDDSAMLLFEQALLPPGEDDLALEPTTLDLDQLQSLETSFSPDYDIFAEANTDISPLLDITAGFSPDIFLADCISSSPSELSLFARKSRRFKREICKSSAIKPFIFSPLSLFFTDSIPDFGGSREEMLEIFRIQNPPLYQLLIQSSQNADHNVFCYLYTVGVLPFGVCSSGNSLDIMSSNLFLSNTDGISLPLSNLDYCSLGEY